MASLHAATTGSSGYVKDLAFDVYGKRLAVVLSSLVPRVEVYDMDEGGAWRAVSSWAAHEQTINAVAWAHPRFGQILATCSDDSTVELWEEFGTGAGNLGAQQSGPKWHKRCTLSDAKKPIKDCAFAPHHQGLKLAVASMDGRVYAYEALDVMNLADWTLDSFFDAFDTGGRAAHARSPGVRCLSWNPSRFDAPMVVVGGEGDDDGQALVRVWTYGEANKQWLLSADLATHAHPDCGCQVNDVAWAPNMGRSFHLIASAGQDQHAQLKVHRLLRTQDGVVPDGTLALATADQPQGIWRAEWNATGTVLATSGEEGAVRLWKSTFRGDFKEVKAVPTAAM